MGQLKYVLITVILSAVFVYCVFFCELLSHTFGVQSVVFLSLLIISLIISSLLLIFKDKALLSHYQP